jgi:hypothetical protein
MSHTYKLSRRIARLRAPLAAALVLSLGLAACDGGDSLNPDDSTAPGVLEDGSAANPLAAIEEDSPVPDEAVPIELAAAVREADAVSFSGGIPMGTFAQPTSTIGSLYNGALQNNWPEYLVKELAALKSRGGKVVLTFTGTEKYFRDADGHFSLTKWKARVDRFKGVNFSSYVTDGTIIGHYLIDEPNDPANWNGRPVPASTVEEMARYSKQLWPSLTTIVRVDPGYLAYNHRYLDAAWAQYVNRKGSASDYIRRNVSDAQARGLALITGMNILKGGPNGSRMTATQIRDWGSTLLGSSYPCAFISWQYNSSDLSTSSVKSAMGVLRDRAENRATKSCRG